MQDSQETIVNAIITSAEIQVDNVLTAWIYLDYGGGLHQGYGGYALQLPKGFKHHKLNGPAGYFIFRVMQIAAVDKWKNLQGKAIRVKTESGKILAIGHIIEDDWFNFGEDLKGDNS